MKINSRHHEEYEADNIHVICNCVEYIIKDEGKNGFKIMTIDNEYSSLSIMPNVANSVNIKAINFQNTI